MVSPSSLMSTTLAPLDIDVEEPSNFKVHIESAIATNSASPTSPGTFCEITELSSQGN